MRSPQLTAAVLALSLAASAQQATPKAPKPASDTPEHPTDLPVTRVSLYKNGVGFFEHTGHVTGNSAVTIDFTSSQLNDVLQSLTAIDLNGGRISGAGYNSTAPLEQQLRNLPISLSENPTAADFYAAIRGARVDVRSGATTITGRLLAVEDRSASTGDSDAKTNTDRYFLTVVSDSGDVKSLELTPTTSVQLLDTTLHTDVTRYLQLLDANRSQGLRHLTLDDKGTGSRELRVSYISEVPIWKSTYRILFTDSSKSTESQTATLQGWSVVDNTTGTDWLNVQLSLIAGAPQSFIQPLSQPIYSRRPEIPIATEAQLTPQTFDSSIESDKFSGGGLEQLGTGPLSQAQLQNLANEGRSKTPNSVANYSAGILGGPLSSAVAHGGGNGIGAGYGGSMGGGVMKMSAPPPASYEDEASTSISPTTKAAAFDDFFAYNLTEPVTIRKNESALVPILQAKIEADRVTLVSSNGYSTTQPLRALWITNTSGLTLDSGSFSIVENGKFGGEGLLDPIHDKEKRLLSYAADQAVHVSTEKQLNNSRVTHITAAKGVLTLHSAVQNEITYVVHNSAADPRTIVLEHPVQKGYELTSDVKATETTPTVYRFRLAAEPGKTVRLRVAASHRGASTYQLTRSDDNQFTYIISQSGNDATLQTALTPILEARRHVADAQTALDQTKAVLDSLHKDEERQRANITALATADKDSRQRFVHDLNQTEDKITVSQTELTSRTAALETAKADLANRIENLQLDEQISQR
jgi:hypothetical protein